MYMTSVPVQKFAIRRTCVYLFSQRILNPRVRELCSPDCLIDSKPFSLYIGS